MIIIAVPLLHGGVDVPHAEWSQNARHGSLEIKTTDDQGRHERVRLARLRCSDGLEPCLLWNTHLLWLKGSRFVLTGYQQVRRPDGIASYRQSWLCELDMPTSPFVEVMELYKDGMPVMRRYRGEIARRDRGRLRVDATLDDDLRRVARIAHLQSESAIQLRDILDVDIVWARDWKMEISGFQRLQRDAGVLQVRQSWICHFTAWPPAPEPRTGEASVGFRVKQLQEAAAGRVGDVVTAPRRPAVLPVES